MKTKKRYRVNWRRPVKASIYVRPVMVFIEYPGRSLELDSALVKLSKSCRGQSTGSGFNFINGARDIEFEFVDLKRARSFKARAERLMRKLGQKI